uniref:tRNA (guanosine(18)-2'-O)-methyltransferase TARBP1 n=1 Tax=Cyclopterus lumpus TaxID=8103 RepID=A0A8C3G6W9_CYCLU
MFSVLIDAVLSSSPDYDILFESLTWPSDSWPGTERVEALTAFIEGLGPILSESDTTPLSAAKRRSIVDKINSVVWNQCLPLLSKVSTRAGEGMRCRETTAAACRLVSVCVPLCDEAVSGRVALSVLRSLQQSEEEMPGPGRLGVEVASEVMAALVPSLSADEQLTLTTLSYALSCIKTLPDSLVSKITVRLLLTVLKCCSGARLTSVLKLILEDMCRWHSTDRTPVVTERTLLCLTALSDHLLKPRSLPSSCDLDPRLCVQFWRMVQDGLTHRDCVSRKRALYLLKMCVSLSEQEGFDCPLSPSEEDILFKWAPSRSMLLREFWEDYALVMETLEENQIHVVRPVLNRIDTALSVAASGQVFFHPSWLLCVYQRMFHSENKSLMREGVCHLLELQALQQPAFFIVGPFMDVLSERSLFHKSVGQSVGECPELGAKLQVFMTTFFTSLPSEHRGRMLLQMIQQLCSKHWCAAPLLFLSQALSKLPPGPLLGIEGLTALREVLRCTMVTHQVLLRGAAQCFLLNSALCLTKVSAVTFDDVFSFLVHFRADESLSRRTQIWNQLCAWLSDNEGSFKPRIMDGDCTKKETVRGYVQSEIFPCSSGLSERLPDSREADKLARAVLLCVDMERNHNKAKIGTTLESLLSPLLDTLSRVGTNLYLPLRKSDKSLQLVLQLFQLGGTPSCERVGEEQVDNVMVAMERLIFKLVDPIQEFILRRLLGELQEVNDDSSESPIILLFFSDAGEQGLLLQDWGRIAANFMRDQWICLSFLMKAFGIPESVEISNDSETLKAALSCGVEALALLPSDLVLPVLTFIETVLPHLLLHDEPMCVEAVTLSWELVQGLSTNAHDFWPALKGFISMAFHRKLLELTDTSAPTLLAALKQVIQIRLLMELSQSKSGVFGVLLQHCCQTWLPTDQDSDNTVFSSVFSHINILTEACVYGPVFRRDQRLIQDVQTYVERLGEECAANVAVTRDDQLPRTCVLAFLSHLESSNLQHERLMEELIMDLLKTDNDISKSKVRYYSNSLQHRVKNRVWQTLLLLLPKLRVEFVATVLNCVFEAGFCSNHASVKYQIEWMMILILVHYPHHIDSFWACFNRDHDKTKTSICTFLSVLVHFNVIIPHLQDKDVHLRKALDIILQWCFNHNFSVRLYALLALKRVWSLAGVQAEEGAGGLGGLSVVIEACLNQAEAMQSTGNANKNWTRIQEHFFFGAFHPVRDYSVETIFYTFPSLSEMADDEWIPPWKFEKVLCFSESPSFPLRNPAPDLSQLQPGDWIQQDKGEQNKEERWAEVQKKITPWRLGIQEQEPELQLIPQQRAARLGKLHGALLVVASLIDKPTNLGGLCRTCEIFGASALVLDSLRHVSDKHFQSLSVSSELWLPLLEVKPMELTDFLQVKKSEGYCIVGVEQTANSQSLQDYQFPEKTLLLLGNEREGIPANLLQMFDVCVEIPQQGVTRSLNVHVSAALLIWEYTRQHLTSGSAEVNSKT